jgi:hypothetical protein
VGGDRARDLLPIGLYPAVVGFREMTAKLSS